jgi:hypothetical protein
MAPPKPRVGDFVEKSNLSKMFGTVRKIKSNSKVIVEWNDKMAPYRKVESISTLALTGRRNKGAPVYPRPLSGFLRSLRKK